MIQMVRTERLAQLQGIRHGFFTRFGGVSEGIYASLNCGPGSADDPAAVKENRARAARSLGAHHADILTLYQVHGANVVEAREFLPREAFPKADAVVTTVPGLAVGVLTADCAPVLLAATSPPTVAAAHAGWRGALAGVVESAIAAMERLGARRQEIVAAVGPAISPEAYEVGPEFEAQFLAADPESAPYFHQDGEGARPHFDLPGYVVSRLRRAGAGTVEQLNACTYTGESMYFSFRRSQHRSEPDYGRQISAIVIG